MAGDSETAEETPEFADPMREFLKEQRKEHEVRVKMQDTLMASQEYQQEVKYSSRFMWDFLTALRICWFYSSRGGSIYDNSIVIRSTDDLVQSTIATSVLLRNGMHTPIKRELRYIIESSVKNLYVDQQMEVRKPLPSLAERLDFLHDHVDRSSIDVREHLRLVAFDAATEKQFIDELNDVYRDCCAYVHPSKRQIEERLDLAEQGRSSGFETAEELRAIAKLMFRVYDMALTLYFHGFGLSMTGDVFTNGFDDRPEWKFHKGKYVKLVSAHFDYKVERKSRQGD
jgi:hypothetical protein